MLVSEIERVSIPYVAPVFVTVNVKTGDVERVYLDDEDVVLDEAQTIDCVDHAVEPIVAVADELSADPETRALIKRALELAENVDWTSTENRCQVWRGAYGGPGDIVAILKACVDFMADFSGQFPSALARAGITESELRATQLFLHDSQIWESEH